MVRTDTNTNTNISNTNTQSNIIHSKIVVNNELEQLKCEIENKVNPKTLNESMYLLSNPELLLHTMQEGADLFKEKTGRDMSCSEMRRMYG